MTRPLIDARGALWIASLLSLTLFLVASAGAQALSAPSEGQVLPPAGHEVDTQAPSLEETGQGLGDAPGDGRQNSPQATSTQALPGGIPAALLLGVGAVAAVSAGGLLILTHRRRDTATSCDQAPLGPAPDGITSIDEADVDDGSVDGDQELEPEEITVNFPADLPPGLGGILRLGQRAVDDGDYEEAAIWFRTALDVEPDLPVAHLCLGLCRGEVEGPEAALESLDRAVALDPTNAMARYCRAQALARDGQTGAVIEALAPLAPGTQAIGDAILDDPAFADLRDHPRLLDLLGRL